MKRRARQYGFAIAEMLTVVAVASILIGGLVAVSGRVFTVSRFEFEQVRVTEDGRKEMERVSDTVRNSRSVDRNGDGVGTAANELWLQQAQANSLTVFTNVDGDPESELVRYFVDASGTVLQRGVIESNGGAYNSPETVQSLVRSLRNPEQGVAIFTYLPAESDIPFTTPLSADQLRLVQRVGITLHIDVSTQQDPPAARLYTLVTPRFGVCTLAGCPGGSLPPPPSGSPGATITPSSGPTSSPVPLPLVDIKVSYDNSAPTDGPISVPISSSVVLSWNAPNAILCSAIVGWSGTAFAPSGSRVINNVDRTTGFSIACFNDHGGSSDYVRVDVIPSRVTLRANGADNTLTVSQFTPVTLSWDAVSVTNCVASGAPPSWNGARPLSGSQFMDRLSASVTYRLRCNGPQGSFVEDEVVVTVAPTVELKVNGADSIGPVAYNTPLNLSWQTVPEITSCVGTGIWSGGKATNGSETVGARRGEYRLQCSALTGTYSDSFTVALTPPTLTFTADPTTLASGGSTTLTSVVSGASSCFASSDPFNGAWSGDKSPAGGSQTITGITATTDFTLKCSNGLAADDVTRTIRVNVAVPPTITSFTASPSTITSGNTTTLSWASTNSASCSISSITGTFPSSASYTTPALTATRTYTLTCTGLGGSVTSNPITVTVNPAPPPASVDIRANGSNGPLTVPAGSPFTLTWSASGVASCTTTGHWTGTVTLPTGSRTISGIFIRNRVYGLSCTRLGGGGTVTDSVVVTIP